MPVATKLRDRAVEERAFRTLLSLPHRERPRHDRRSTRALVDTPSGCRLRPPPLSGLQQTMAVGGGLRDHGIDDSDAVSTTDLRTAVVLDFPACARRVWSNASDCAAPVLHSDARDNFMDQFSKVAAPETMRDGQELPSLSIQARFRIIVGVAALLWLMIASAAWALFI